MTERCCVRHTVALYCIRFLFVPDFQLFYYLINRSVLGLTPPGIIDAIRAVHRGCSGQI